MRMNNKKRNDYRKRKKVPEPKLSKEEKIATEEIL